MKYRYIGPTIADNDFLLQQDTILKGYFNDSAFVTIINGAELWIQESEVKLYVKPYVISTIILILVLVFSFIKFKKS